MFWFLIIGNKDLRIILVNEANFEARWKMIAPIIETLMQRNGNKAQWFWTIENIEKFVFRENSVMDKT